MSEVAIDTSKIKVEINNMGIITFISNDGKMCIVYIHPSDNAKLIKFLVNQGYNFNEEAK